MSWALLASAFVLGLLGATHCATMCGGIVAASTVGTARDDKRRLPQLARRVGVATTQNAGRIASYAIGGAIMGGLGQLVGRAAVDEARVAMQLFAALALLAAGLTLSGMIPARAGLERIGVPIWRRVQPVARRLMPIETHGRAFAFGLLWGLVPCGLVYSALSLAILSGGPATGALVMLAFGLGTAPALVAMGALAGLVANLVRRASIRRAAGILIAAFGVLQLVLAVRGALPGQRACCHPDAAHVANAPHHGN